MKYKIVSVKRPGAQTHGENVEGLKRSFVGFLAERIETTLNDALKPYIATYSTVAELKSDFARIQHQYPTAIFSLKSFPAKLLETASSEDKARILDKPQSYSIKTPLCHHFPAHLIADLTEFVTRPENWICDPDPVPIGYVGKMAPEGFFTEENSLPEDALTQLSKLAEATLRPYVVFHWFDAEDNKQIVNWHVDSNERERGELKEPFYSLTFSENDAAGTWFVRIPRLDCEAFIRRHPEVSEATSYNLIQCFEDETREFADKFLTQNPETKKEFQQSAQPGYLYKGLINRYYHRSPEIQVQRLHCVLRGEDVGK